ncbi:PREDICTED: caprin homolog isoform X2 [Vollenhovia emeryi]|uniref:caprin homolog isoform X2 n=1 Tax=Vollenhovia emeryi TaxID=411798 RepID=UPI0005F43352|nr:PREDICTED: caprin homolog isoform X2 [Vollenhovia emeryi]XP_011869683.1 PREDICTED: caprin homolog isoform X2 [Vollenhovia emeryi]
MHGGRLESYRDLQKNGRELNSDQKTAVAKYDEVLQTLDITRDLYKQIVNIANDAVKQQKKLARKEAVERMQQDIAKVKEVLLTQQILISINTESIRDDFFHGKNGAIKLSEEEFKYLDSLYNEMMIKHQREEGDLTFVQQAQKVAEHYVAIVDGKQREVIGTTYNKLKEIIAKINQCGYFDQVHECSEATPIEEVTESVTETKISSPQVTQEQVNEEYSNGNDRHIPPEVSMVPIPNFPVQVATLPVVSGAGPVSGPIPVVPQPMPHPAAPVDTPYYTNATSFVPQPQQQQQQQQQQAQQSQPPPAARINDVIGTPNFFFLQESELDPPESQAPIVSHIPPTVNAPIPTQTFTNQNFATAPVSVPQQVIYQPPQDISHIPGFANPNPPPPIPMPPSHQQPNMQYSPQHPNSFQPQQPQQPQPNAAHLPQQGQMQNFNEQAHQQEAQASTEEKVENGQNEISDSSLEQQNESIDWCQMTETNDWNQSDQQQQSIQDCQQASQQTSQQAWVPDQRGGYRGRGGRRGSASNYNSRGRGNYQQNGRAGQGAYYRNDSNYQNGYQQRAWGNNEGNNGYNSGFKRGSGGGSRGTRNERVSRGQFRGQRGSNRGYAPRGKPHTQ